jgi:hypothetical protein
MPHRWGRGNYRLTSPDACRSVDLLERRVDPGVAQPQVDLADADESALDDGVRLRRDLQESRGDAVSEGRHAA